MLVWAEWNDRRRLARSRVVLKGRINMFRHVALIKWKEDASAEQIQAVLQALSSLPSKCRTIRGWSQAEDLRLDSTNYDFVLIADFESVEGFNAYSVDPHHLAVVQQIGPIRADAKRVQYSF
jgi:quinol monooxygenase YgiN